MLSAPASPDDVAREDVAPEDVAFDVTFTDVTLDARLDHVHAFRPTEEIEDLGRLSGGVAAGDYDGDGWVDLYVVGGDLAHDGLFRNRGDGTFEETAEAAGVALEGRLGCGPLFADLDGDGHLDLLVLGVGGAAPVLFRNRGDGRFEDVTERSGISVSRGSVSASAGDYDLDGDLDLFICQWGGFVTPGHLWRNDGELRFTDVDEPTGIGAAFATSVDWSFSANFADVNSDGWPDLLVACDFGTSKVFVNARDGTFVEFTTSVISDENGMGTAVGDFDGDGLLDWFVSAIWDPDVNDDATWGGSGNRLYRGLGDGTFEDVTDDAGVRHGGWGWAASFADLDNDADLDLVHVNGYGSGVAELARFHDDRTAMFANLGGGRFEIVAGALGTAVREEGRGLVTFDYDRDGDLDLFIANSGSPVRLLRNDGAHEKSWLRLRLRGRAPNTQAIGARIYAYSNDKMQMRELRAGCNYASQNPAIAHFGLGDAELADLVIIRWPGGAITRLEGVVANQLLELDEPAAPRLLRGDVDDSGRLEIGDAIVALGHLFLGAKVRCEDAVDVDDDGSLDISDPVLLLSFLFLGGESPRAPFPYCGADRSIDTLSCDDPYDGACDD
jgi:hypothetical protein